MWWFNWLCPCHIHIHTHVGIYHHTCHRLSVVAGISQSIPHTLLDVWRLHSRVACKQSCACAVSCTCTCTLYIQQWLSLKIILKLSRLVNIQVELKHIQPCFCIQTARWQGSLDRVLHVSSHQAIRKHNLGKHNLDIHVGINHRNTFVGKLKAQCIHCTIFPQTTLWPLLDTPHISMATIQGWWIE